MKLLFNDLKPFIKKAVMELGFKDFTDVQKQTIERFDSGKSLIVKSKTGSGKTHAYLIPIFQELDPKVKAIQAVIIAPTTELVLQISKFALEIASFSGETIDIKTYYGGTDRNREIEKLKNQMPQIVIGTPGKIKDLAVDQNLLKIFKAKIFVADEVDMIYDEGFIEDMASIAEHMPYSKRFFFSATLQPHIFDFLKKYIGTHEVIDLCDEESLKITHILIPVKHRKKEELLLSLLKNLNPYLVIIFVNKKEMVMPLVNLLSANKMTAGYLYGDMNIRERKRMIDNIKALKYTYVVATDLAARGIDIEGVTHIINYSLPNEFEFYIHRSGRTGRNGLTGIVYSFFEVLDDLYLSSLEKKNIHFLYQNLNTKGELVEYKERNSREDRERPLSGGEKQAIRQIKKPDKVTPGYKRKLAKNRQELAKKIDAIEKEKKNRRKK